MIGVFVVLSCFFYVSIFVLNKNISMWHLANKNLLVSKIGPASPPDQFWKAEAWKNLIVHSWCVHLCPAQCAMQVVTSRHPNNDLPEKPFAAQSMSCTFQELKRTQSFHFCPAQGPMQASRSWTTNSGRSLSFTCRCQIMA